MSILTARSEASFATDCAEVHLAAAVILRALADAGICVTERAAHRPGSLEEADAIRFLTEPGGEWAASRRFWCALAGIDADAFVEKVMCGSGRNRQGTAVQPSSSFE